MRRALLLAMLTALSAVAHAPVSVAGDARWFVLSYDGPIRGADRAALDAISPVLYRHPNSYLVWTSRKVPTRARWSPLDAAEKIAGTAPMLDVVLAADAPLHGVSRIAPVVRGWLADPSADLRSVTVRARPGDAARLAALPEVLSVGPAAMGAHLLDEGTSQVVAGNVPVAPGYDAFLARHGLDGSGVTIAIADSGIDDTHPDLAGRVVARTDFTALPDHRDSDGHGTHVAGAAAGSGRGFPTLAPGAGPTDGSGLRYGLGVAPAAPLVDVGVLGIIEEAVGVDDFPPFESASRFAVRAGAIGWNASWGSGEGDKAGYTPTARTMDILARDADWQTPGAQPFILVFAAGNSGQAGPGAPTEAKNLISVGASLSPRAAGSIDTIASFSSRGPARDGRITPTIVAPGDTVISTRSIVGSVLCNTPPRDARPFAPFYGVCSGTSMAAPHVTGATALVTQWWRRERGGATPSQAMMKALLVNSATDLRTADIPNRNEGWGRVNLSALLEPGVARAAFDQDVTFDDVGDVRTLRVTASDPSRPIKVSLAWSDAPAAPNAAVALVNDLDLTVRAPDGTVYVGNRFAGGWSVAGGSPDARDVLENVYLPQAGAGTYEIEVRAMNLPGDGVPDAGDATDQDFALVVTNGIVS